MLILVYKNKEIEEKSEIELNNPGPGESQLLKMGLLIFSIFLFYYILLYITYITVLLKVVGRFCPCRLLASKSLLRYYSIGKSTL